MRLICPKCNAQYDIASDAIPEGGRDVQCSSCSHTWFQTEKSPDAASVVAPAAPSRAAAEVQSAVTKRKPLDSSIADILRQEAAREKAAADANIASTAAPAVEAPAQPRRNDPIAAEETRRRIAMMADEDTATPAATAAAATGAVAGGTNLRSVPSIDEINQQLRARSQSAEAAEQEEYEQYVAVERRGFRRGFAFITILIAIGIAPYIFAEQIVAKFPQTAEPMEAYVAVLDDLRLWLNDQYQTVRAMIDDYTGSAAPAEPAPAVESTAPVAPAAPSE